MDTATREPVAGDEYYVECPCGYSDYYAPSCSCEHCKNTNHPLQKCPECGRDVIDKSESRSLDHDRDH